MIPVALLRTLRVGLCLAALVSVSSPGIARACGCDVWIETVWPAAGADVPLQPVLVLEGTPGWTLELRQDEADRIVPLEQVRTLVGAVCSGSTLFVRPKQPLVEGAHYTLRTLSSSAGAKDGVLTQFTARQQGDIATVTQPARVRARAPALQLRGRR